MTAWRIKEISELTKISVRMLRHYDKVGILKPSYRSSNGYRWYTANDLAKLQQIIALRYFGFNLRTISSILQKHNNLYAHLQAQLHVVKAQRTHLQQVDCALQDILKRFSESEIPNCQDLLTLIERYHMTVNLRKKLQDTWAGQKLSESQFEEYLFIYEKFPKECAARDEIMEKINRKEFGDAEGPDGEQVARFMYDFSKKTKELFSTQMKFNSSLMKSIQSGKLNELEVSPEGAAWLRDAFFSFWLKRWDNLYQNILENIHAEPEGKVGKQIAQEWTGLIDDYFSIGSPSFLQGVLIWNELARQKQILKDVKGLQSPQEMVKEYRIKLLYNPDATSWISRALEAHIQ